VLHRNRATVRALVLRKDRRFGFQANLAVQEVRLGKAMHDLNEAQQQLDEKEAELQEVQAQYDKAISHKQALIDDAEACKRKMINASALIEGLGGEKVRSEI